MGSQGERATELRVPASQVVRVGCANPKAQDSLRSESAEPALPLTSYAPDTNPHVCHPVTPYSTGIGSG